MSRFAVIIDPGDPFPHGANHLVIDCADLIRDFVHRRIFTKKDYFISDSDIPYL